MYVVVRQGVQGTELERRALVYIAPPCGCGY